MAATQAVNKSPNASIQAYFEAEKRSPEKKCLQDSRSQPGDGFTEEEVAENFNPLNCNFDSGRDYEDCSIGRLVPGPRAVTFAGRIVYMKTLFGRDAKHPKAAGYHELTVKDDSAAIGVKLYFANTPFPFKLGQLVTLWSAFISDASRMEKGAIPGIAVYASLFPARVNSDSITIQSAASVDRICRTPLEYNGNKPLPGLMTLDTYLKGGNDGVPGVKLLLCVKSIGVRRTVKLSGEGGERDLIAVMVFDHTGEYMITFWQDLIDSVREWQAGKTILLISNPGWIVDQRYHKGKIGIMRATMIDIDPEFPDADWLRRYAVSLTKKEAPVIKFPEGIWDIEASKYGVNRILFSLAEIDKWVRSNPNMVFSGFVNVTILEFPLATLHRKNMLMCGECCGVPIYKNAFETQCRNCTKEITLSPNPKIVGTLIDETGSIAPGKLIWHDDAWQDIFDRTIQGIAEMNLETARLYEQRLASMRLHLCFGWSEDVGRLCIMGMMA